MLTDEDAIVACRKIGYDLSCGACAERFFTGGWWGSEHDEGCETIPELKRTRSRLLTFRWKNRRIGPSRLLCVYRRGERRYG